MVGSMPNMKINAVTLLCAAALIISATTADAQTRRQRERQPPEPAGDRRDRIVNAPGTPFHGNPYWQALAQCGGAYFKLGGLYNDIAIRARVIKPDRATDAEFSKKYDEANRTASAFFDAAERMLITDRNIERPDAIMTYDARASAVGDRLKTVEAAVQATQACPALYRTCRQAFERICQETAISRIQLPRSGQDVTVTGPTSPRTRLSPG